MAEPSSPWQLSSASSKHRRTSKAVSVDEALVKKTSNESDASDENSEGENSLMKRTHF